MRTEEELIGAIREIHSQCDGNTEMFHSALDELLFEQMPQRVQHLIQVLMDEYHWWGYTQ